MSNQTTEYFNEVIPKLGFGCMRFPTIKGNDKEIDIAQTIEMVDYYMSNGMNYFDTAFMYHGGKSEEAVKEAVTKRYDRSKYFLADKLPIWEATTKEDIAKIFQGQLEKCGVEYFDFYLHHALDKGKFEKCQELGAFEYIQQMKAEGKIKHVGFSFHDTPDVLETILKAHPEMEFVQLQINYMDWYGDLRSDEYYRLAREHNKPIIIMEPVKGGILANVPSKIKDLFNKINPNMTPASWAIRYCASLDGVMTILSGMSNMEQLKDNVTVIKDFKPINEQEKETLEKAVAIYKELNSVPCTKCNYCDKCPIQIDIPGNFAILNKFSEENNMDNANEALGKINSDNSANKCIECGLCESVCPQQIKIIDTLKYISEKFKVS